MDRNTEIMDRIREVAHASLPKGGRVLLYGSRARGDAKEDSDWDLLLLLNKEKLEQSDYDEIAAVLRGFGGCT